MPEPEEAEGDEQERQEEDVAARQREDDDGDRDCDCEGTEHRSGVSAAARFKRQSAATTASSAATDGRSAKRSIRSVTAGPSCAPRTSRARSSQGR